MKEPADRFLGRGILLMQSLRVKRSYAASGLSSVRSANDECGWNCRFIASKVGRNKRYSAQFRQGEQSDVDLQFLPEQRGVPLVPAYGNYPCSAAVTAASSVSSDTALVATTGCNRPASHTLRSVIPQAMIPTVLKFCSWPFSASKITFVANHVPRPLAMCWIDAFALRNAPRCCGGTVPVIIAMAAII